MQVESSDHLRNVAVVGHNDTGKTSLVAGLLYTAGVSSRLLKVEDGNTITDFDHEEIERGISIGLAPCFAPWKKHKINLIDCPGLGIFLTESRAAIRAADNAMICVNAVAGAQVSTEKVWQYAGESDVPVLFNLTKMDRENADFARAVENLRNAFGRTIMPIQVPIGAEQEFRGIVDLVKQEAYEFERDGNGSAKKIDIPSELADQVAEWRSQLIEAVAETDDELMEVFFDQGELDQEQLANGLKRAIRERAVFPLTLSSGLHGIGNSTLLDAILDLLPSPAERKPFPATENGEDTEIGADDSRPIALVFKTLNDPFAGKISIFRVLSGTIQADTTYHNSTQDTDERLGHLLALQGKQGEDCKQLVAGDIGGVAKLKTTATGDTLTAKGETIQAKWIKVPVPAISFAIEPKAKGDEEKIGEAAAKLVEEDPTLKAGRDPQTGEFLLAGTGQLHVEIAVAKLKSRFKVEVILHPPKVPYRETIKRPADAHGRHKKQTGGRGQFADCKIKLEPNPGGGFEFVDEIFGGAIPQGFRPAVEKGIQEAAERGYLAGYPVVDFRVRLYDGQYHDVDSSEMAFKIAGSLAFKEAMAKASPTLLEPIMNVEITTTEEFMGDIMSDLSQRRGKPQGMEARGDKQIVKAAVPMAEMLNYAPALRSMTQGRASFTMEFAQYEEVPRNIQEKIIAEAKALEAEAG